MYTIDEVSTAVKVSHSYAEVLRTMGRQITGSSRKSILKYIVKNGIDISHFTFKPNIVLASHRKLPSEILVLRDTGRSKENAKMLRRSMLEIGVEHKCNTCGLDAEWRGSYLLLEIDHINGNNLDNRRENLRFLCPNCHSQTPNFYHTKLQSFCDCGHPKLSDSLKCRSCSSRSPSKRKVLRPSCEELKKIVWEMPSEKIGKLFGVSGRAVGKWCTFYGISKPPRGYWTRFNAVKG